MFLGRKGFPFGFCLHSLLLLLHIVPVILEHGLGRHHALFPQPTAYLLELLAACQIHGREGEQRHVFRPAVGHTLSARAVQTEVDLVHELAEVIPRLTDTDGRRLHGYLGGGEIAAVLGPSADDDPGNTARRKDLGVHVPVLVVVEHFLGVRLDHGRFAQVIGRCQRGAGHRPPEQSVHRVQGRNIRHDIRFGIAVGHMHEAMRPQIL